VNIDEDENIRNLIDLYIERRVKGRRIRCMLNEKDL
jgi:hypothetical protein